MPKAWNHTQNGWADGECLDYSVSPCVKLSESWWSRWSCYAVWECMCLYEKRAELYLHVTKSGVLTGFGSRQKHCVTKNERCCSSRAKFLCFLESLNSPLLLIVGRKERPKTWSTFFIAKQEALGRELVQVQEPGLLRTPFVQCHPVAVCLEPVYLWQAVVSSPAA